MLGLNLETPRPLPPAKARKANAMRKISSSPPPAYGSPFTFPARRQMRQDILGSPMAKTFQMVGWDVPSEEPEGAEPSDVAWINEKSREELKELLVKADVLIKERENELGITSAVCKGLFQSNVALKSRHEALLARIPSSPVRSNSSPSNLNQQSLLPEEYADGHITTSSSESALDRSRSPSPILSRRHARKVSIAAADVSLLSDQNAELMEKLERLEKEATSSDQAGRRELKRLEKEITFLREALEKTQARSDELEAKVQGAVASQAWRRKKEREAKFRAMRNIGRGAITDSSSNAPSFAPHGSTFGGPSETFSFFPRESSPVVNPSEQNDFYTDLQVESRTSLKPHEHSLITQLLVKVQELEDANAKILQKQVETAKQLSAVQRDTAHMSRVYECLSDHDSLELELADAQGWDDQDDNAFDDEKDTLLTETVRFRSLKRTLANEVQSLRGTCIVHPEFTSNAKTRKTVMGLFDGEGSVPQQVESDHSCEDNIPSDSSPWTEGHNNTSWSSEIMGGPDGTTSTRLSPLHFFSPPSQILAELSPLAGRPTLHAELAQGLNGSWNETQDRECSNRHLRSSSLYDFSQISVPPSPSPSSRSLSRRNSNQLDFDVMQTALGKNAEERTPRDDSFLMPSNTLQLSVEPTPEQPHSSQFRTGESNDRSTSAMPKSPRIKLTSDVFRTRPNRWVARRLRSRSIERGRVNFTSLDIDGYGDQELLPDTAEQSPIAPSSALAIPKRLMNAVDSMIGGFDNAFSRRTSTPVREVYYLDAGASDNGDDYLPTPVTPRAQPHGDERRSCTRRRSGAGDRGAYDCEIDALIDTENAEETWEDNQVQVLSGSSAASTPQKSGTARDDHQSFIVKVWLWIQFAIVVFVFLYAMARRGPKTMLTDEHRRAVVRRR